MPRLLLTRARPQAEGFAARLRAATSLEPLIAPMQEMRPLPAEPDLRGISALAFTSQNGVEAFAKISQSRLPAYCVGEATAARARALGFPAVSAAGNGDDLAKILPASGVLHLHGRHVRKVLSRAHMAIYEQVALPLDPGAARLLATGQLETVALFSPRSAALLTPCLPAPSAAPSPVFYVLSEAIAAALPKGLALRIAPQPNAAALLRLLSADFPPIGAGQPLR